MMNRIVSVILVMLALGVSLGFCSEKSLLKNKEKFNIILIVVDALRADHLGCYGYFRNTSPNIDKLAREGALFKNAFSQGSRTAVSIPSIINSLYPGVNMQVSFKDLLENKFNTFPEDLRRIGYSTALFGCLELALFAQFNYGFDNSEIMDSGKFNGAITIRPNWLKEKAISWLRQQSSKPFFLFFHCDYTHEPYNPPAPYDSMFPQEADIQTKEFFRSFVFENNLEKFDLMREKLKNPGNLSYLISQYDGEIRYIDDLVKDLLDELDRLKLSKNTLIILTSDHGEDFLEHGFFFHGGSLYDESIRVPLIIRLPGKVPQDKIVNTFVEHVDIVPTIFDLLDIHSDRIMQGRSLVPLLHGGAVHKTGSFSEVYSNSKSLRAIRTDKFKFIQEHKLKSNSYSYELFDLKADPKEKNNLIKEMPKKVESFKAWLSSYTLSCEKTKWLILKNKFFDKQLTSKEEQIGKAKSLMYMH